MTSAKKQHRRISPMPVVSSFPPLRPIPNWPGYSISADGQVYSSRKSINGTPKPLKTNSQGAVQLRGLGNNTKWRRTADLAKEIWR